MPSHRALAQGLDVEPVISLVLVETTANIAKLQIYCTFSLLSITNTGNMSQLVME